MPGLGADPEKSWVSGKTEFNWTTEALARDFPKARLLLYKYESAWSGALKVKQFMANLAMAMLISLQSQREVCYALAQSYGIFLLRVQLQKCPRRPIVFIGHSSE